MNVLSMLCDGYLNNSEFAVYSVYFGDFGVYISIVKARFRKIAGGINNVE
jgi:hypothetical protein